MNSYLTVMHEIHVLFVDHDLEDLVNVTRLLETCQYRVTHFQLASAAIQMLSNGKVKFDFIIANINSPDLHGYNLLQLALTIKIPIILTSSDDNMALATRVIEKGAFLFIKKPINLEILTYIWQHVAGEEANLMRERYNYSLNPNIDYNVGDDYGLSEKRYYNPTSHGRVKRKVCTEWTQELHEKFMNAVQQLGEGRCFPKEIVELMNVPGLTRMQVASHLQKCRKDNWKFPHERKHSMGIQSSEGEGSNHKPRQFGSMPQLGKAPSYHEEDDFHSMDELGLKGLFVP